MYIGICEGGPWHNQMLSHVNNTKEIEDAPKIPASEVGTRVTSDPDHINATGHYTYNALKLLWEWAT